MTNRFETLLSISTCAATKWLVAIILRELKLGYGDEPILWHYHQDAKDMYNMAGRCRLKRVESRIGSALFQRFKVKADEPLSSMLSFSTCAATTCTAT
jgi:hypothetical protein